MTHGFWLSTHTFLVGEKKRLQSFEVESFDIVRHVNGIPAASIVLIYSHGGSADQWQKTSADVALCKPGEAVEIGLIEDGKRDAVVLFSGTVTEQRVQGGQASTTLHLRASHVLHRLNDGPRYQVHQASEKEALVALFKNNRISDFSVGELAELDTSEQPDERLIQWACTDWQWLRARLHAHGAWLFPTLNGAICALPHLEPKGAPHRKVHRLLAANGDAILACAWSFNNALQPAKTKGIAVRYWQESAQALSPEMFGEVSPIGTGAFNGALVASNRGDAGAARQAEDAEDDTAWMIRHSANHFDTDAKAEANARLLAQHACAIGFSVNLMASRDTVTYELGDVLAVEEFGESLSGQGLITGIRHWWARGVFETTVNVGLGGAVAVDAALVPRAPGLTVGTVAKAPADDPRSDYRVYVNVPLLGHCLWARHAIPYASDGAGIRMPLDVGDEVMLAFLDEDPRYPVILGSTHSEKRKAPGTPGSGETGLTLSGNRKFSITAEGEIEISGSAVNLKKSSKAPSA